MIGRAIDGEIERNFHPAFAHLFLQPIKIGQRSERRLDRLMPTGFAADRPRHPWITRLAGDRIVPPLAVGVTYGMDRRKINDIEAHGFGVVHSEQAIAESRSAIAAPFC